MKVACFGELLFDHIEGIYYLGGAPTNFAGHCAKLGAETYLITAVGNDDLGRRGLAEATSHGIKADFISTVDQPTGTVEVTLAEGIPSYDIAFSAWDHISFTDKQEETIQKIDLDLFYFGSLAQRTEENRAFLMKLLPSLRFKEAFLDVNLRQEFFSTEILKTSFTYATIIKVNDEELPIISGMLFEEDLKAHEFFARIAKKYEIHTLILTCGKEGAYYYTSDIEGHVIPKDVKVVDTVGAGDSFSAGFMSALFQIGDVEKAVIFATYLADFVVSSQGALPHYPARIQAKLDELKQD